MFDNYQKLVYEKHLQKYGKQSADNICVNADRIFNASIEQISDEKRNNNVLLVGKVQSGKTSNLEMLTAKAFDNGFELLIMYGGYDTTLLAQTCNRFINTFSKKNTGDIEPIVLSTSTIDFSYITEDFFSNARESRIPIIIMAMKRPVALNKVNNTIQAITSLRLKAFIIDDEGDQASLNTKKDKTGEASATYKAIVRMKELLQDPLYFAVTATPQANIFQPEISKLRPESVHLIPPGTEYTGADCFHLRDKNIITITEDDENDLIEGNLVSSLRIALNYFILSNAILSILGKNKTDMIIHAFREVDGHEVIFSTLSIYINNIKDCIKYDDTGISFIFEELQEIYTKEYFPIDIINKYPWSEKIEQTIVSTIKKTIIVQQNSKNIVDSNIIKLFDHVIYIGGDLLQRGITFNNLTTTYFTRWAKSGNMDTTLQRARWFGYRLDYIDFCKIFMPYNIQMEFTNLAEIENDLWEQFSLVEKKELTLNDIIIEAEDTSLNPTRKNVTDYITTSFSKKWNSQRYACFDQRIVEHNNLIVEKFFNNKKMEYTSIGRNDNKSTASYCIIDSIYFINLINDSKVIFDLPPFDKKDLINVLSNKKICIEYMNFDGFIRERSCDYENKISALQQGTDNIQPEKQKYKGDSFVIVDNSLICIQIFKIRPVILKEKKENLVQYMFSFHFPKNTIVYRKN